MRATGRTPGPKPDRAERIRISGASPAAAVLRRMGVLLALFSILLARIVAGGEGGGGADPAGPPEGLRAGVVALCEGHLNQPIDRAGYRTFNRKLAGLVARHYPDPATRPPMIEVLRRTRADALEGGYGWGDPQRMEAFERFEQTLDRHRYLIAQESMSRAVGTVAGDAEASGERGRFRNGLVGGLMIGSADPEQMNFTRDIDLTFYHLDGEHGTELVEAVKAEIARQSGVPADELDVVPTAAPGFEKEANVFVDDSSRWLVYEKLLPEGGETPAMRFRLEDGPDGPVARAEPISAREFNRLRWEKQFVRADPSTADADGRFVGFENLTPAQRDRLAARYQSADLEAVCELKSLDLFGVLDMLVHHEQEVRARVETMDLSTAIEKGGKYSRRATLFLGVHGRHPVFSKLKTHPEYGRLRNVLDTGRIVTEVKKDLSRLDRRIEAAKAAAANGEAGAALRLGELDSERRRLVAYRDGALRGFFATHAADLPEFEGTDAAAAEPWRSRYLEINAHALHRLGEMVVDQAVVECLSFRREVAVGRLPEIRARLEHIVTRMAGSGYEGLDGTPFEAWARQRLKMLSDLEELARHEDDWAILQKHRDKLVGDLGLAHRLLSTDPLPAAEALLHGDLRRNRLGRTLTKAVNGVRNAMVAGATGTARLAARIEALRVMGERRFGGGGAFSALNHLDMALTLGELVPADGSLPDPEAMASLVMMALQMKIPYLSAAGALLEPEGRTERLVLEIAYLFCPVLAAPEVAARVTRRLGEGAIRSARSALFENQLEILYQHSTFEEGRTERPRFVAMETNFARYAGVEGMVTFLARLSGGLQEQGAIFDPARIAPGDDSVASDVVRGVAHLTNRAVPAALVSMLRTGDHGLFRNDPELAALCAEAKLHRALAADLREAIEAGAVPPGASEHQQLAAEEEALRKAMEAVRARLAAVIVDSFEERRLAEEADILTVVSLDRRLAKLARALWLGPALLLKTGGEPGPGEAMTLPGRAALRAPAGERGPHVQVLLSACEQYDAVVAMRNRIAQYLRQSIGVEPPTARSTVENTPYPLTGLFPLQGDPAYDLRKARQAIDAFDLDTPHGDLFGDVDAFLVDEEIAGGYAFLAADVSKEERNRLKRMRFAGLVDELALCGKTLPSPMPWLEPIRRGLSQDEFVDIVTRGATADAVFAFERWVESLRLSTTLVGFDLLEEVAEVLDIRQREGRAFARARLALTARRYWSAVRALRRRLADLTAMEVELRPAVPGRAPDAWPARISLREAETKAPLWLQRAEEDGAHGPLYRGIVSPEARYRLTLDLGEAGVYDRTFGWGGLTSLRPDTAAEPPFPPVGPARLLVAALASAPRLEITLREGTYDGGRLGDPAMIEAGAVLAATAGIGGLDPFYPAAAYWRLERGDGTPVPDVVKRVDLDAPADREFCRLRMRFDTLAPGPYRLTLALHPAGSSEPIATAAAPFALQEAGEPQAGILRLVAGEDRTGQRAASTMADDEPLYAFVYFRLNDAAPAGRIRLQLVDAQEERILVDQTLRRERAQDAGEQRVGMKVEPGRFAEASRLRFEATVWPLDDEGEAGEPVTASTSLRRRGAGKADPEDVAGDEPAVDEAAEKPPKPIPESSAAQRPGPSRHGSDASDPEPAPEPSAEEEVESTAAGEELSAGDVAERLFEGIERADGTEPMETGEPQVVITSPEDGLTTGKNQTEVRASLLVDSGAPPPVKEVGFLVNGTLQLAELAGTTFSTIAVLTTGQNTLQARLVTEAGTVYKSEPVTVRCTAEHNTWHIRITWDKNETDVDIHFEWSGADVACSYRNREPSWGGGRATSPRLDVDDTDGYGPENITIGRLPGEGTYKVFVHYYSDHGNGGTNVTAQVLRQGRSVYKQTKHMTHGERWTLMEFSSEGQPFVDTAAAGGPVSLAHYTAVIMKLRALAMTPATAEAARALLAEVQRAKTHAAGMEAVRQSPLAGRLGPEIVEEANALTPWLFRFKNELQKVAERDKDPARRREARQLRETFADAWESQGVFVADLLARRSGFGKEWNYPAFDGDREKTAGEESEGEEKAPKEPASLGIYTTDAPWEVDAAQKARYQWKKVDGKAVLHGRMQRFNALDGWGVEIAHYWEGKRHGLRVLYRPGRKYPYRLESWRMGERVKAETVNDRTGTVGETGKPVARVIMETCGPLEAKAVFGAQPSRETKSDPRRRRRRRRP
jgi:uncharacterized protein YfaP (DUF2135 family)